MARERIAIPMNEDAAMRRAVDRAAEVLAGGGVVVFPTETVYGVGVASGDAAALAALRRLKERDAGKPFQFLAADMTMATKLGAVFPAGAKNLAESFWPGPMTLVVPDGTGGMIGVRIPDSPFVLELCRKLDRAIVSSSANPAGAPPPPDADAADAFGDDVALLVDGGPVVGGVPSTVVRCSGEGFEILRPGGISTNALVAAWNG